VLPFLDLLDVSPLASVPHIIAVARLLCLSPPLSEKILRLNHLDDMTQLFAVSVGHTIGVFRTLEECDASVTGYPDSDYKICETEDEAWDYVNADSSVGRKRKRSASDISGRSRSSSPEHQPALGACVPPGPRTSQAASPEVSRQIHETASRNEPPRASVSCLGSVPRQTDNEPHLWVSQGPKPDIEIYTDGSAFDHGKPEARAGFGVWYWDPTLSHLDRSGRLQGGSEKQTDSRAELTVSEQR
jgi:ribonuclease HI